VAVLAGFGADFPDESRISRGGDDEDENSDRGGGGGGGGGDGGSGGANGALINCGKTAMTAAAASSALEHLFTVAAAFLGDCEPEVIPEACRALNAIGPLAKRHGAATLSKYADIVGDALTTAALQTHAAPAGT
jgi:hypothetical protein